MAAAGSDCGPGPAAARGWQVTISSELAHEALADMRPARDAPLSEWLAYHQRATALYAEVAEIDRGHHHEKLFMAEQERQRAKVIKAQIAAQSSIGEEVRG